MRVVDVVVERHIARRAVNLQRVERQPGLLVSAGTGCRTCKTQRGSKGYQNQKCNLHAAGADRGERPLRFLYL